MSRLTQSRSQGRAATRQEVISSCEILLASNTKCSPVLLPPWTSHSPGFNSLLHTQWHPRTLLCKKWESNSHCSLHPASGQSPCAIRSHKRHPSNRGNN